MNAETNRFPASIAELEILCIALIANTSNAENLALTVSTEDPKDFISTFFTLLLRFSNPLEVPSKCNAFLNLSNVDNVLETPCSNCLLSNFRETTFSSTISLIF